MLPWTRGTLRDTASIEHTLRPFDSTARAHSLHRPPPLQLPDLLPLHPHPLPPLLHHLCPKPNLLPPRPRHRVPLHHRPSPLRPDMSELRALAPREDST
ncbi:hypothetical protein IQ07DRAFT_585169 [Pyrenochaeta sp. DS3sAY3a]|nr:hypothetical protein IQ07DRAFT_585169 [Pyrenochaeta sp. DS3sAY3a]